MEDDDDGGGQMYSLEDVCDRLDNIEAAIESAVKSNKATAGWGGWLIGALIGWLILGWISDAWHSKFRYATQYQIGYDQITIQNKPRDCDFIKAPLGNKGCHYDRTVTTILTRTENSDPAKYSVNSVSYDDGKTWSVDDAVPPTKPQVVISWQKVDDE